MGNTTQSRILESSRSSGSAIKPGSSTGKSETKQSRFTTKCRRYFVCWNNLRLSLDTTEGWAAIHCSLLASVIGIMLTVGIGASERKQNNRNKIEATLLKVETTRSLINHKQLAISQTPLDATDAKCSLMLSLASRLPSFWYTGHSWWELASRRPPLERFSQMRYRQIMRYKR